MWESQNAERENEGSKERRAGELGLRSEGKERDWFQRTDSREASIVDDLILDPGDNL